MPIELWCGYCREHVVFHRDGHALVCPVGHEHPVETAESMVCHDMACEAMRPVREDRGRCTCGAFRQVG